MEINMKARLDKMPPLTGNAVERCEQVRNYINHRLIPELEHAIAAQEKEIEKMKKEVRGNG